ncbi:MAG: hypothetical protein HYX21_01115 [Candidatus Yanofskybacteria bacterium]|nr:hypothetical protein [Candidatus Yanofskybacteria bacterium]
MKRREHFSVEDIKSHLDVKSKIESDILQKIMSEALDPVILTLSGEQSTRPDKSKSVGAGMVDLLFGNNTNINLLIARKLKLNQRNIPLLSQEDTDSLAEEASRAFASKGEPGSKKEELNKKINQQVFKNLINLLIEPQSMKGDKAYEKQWQGIDAILTVARVTKTNFTELPNIPEKRKQVLRLIHKSRKQHRTSLLKVVNKLADPQNIKQVLLVPVLEIVASTEGLTEELATLIKEDFADNFMPKILQSCSQAKENLYPIVEEEIIRVWN